MNILVTGGSGSVGKYVVDELLLHGHTVGVLDLVTPKQKNVIYHAVDVRSIADIERAMKWYNAVIHMAGIPHPLNDPAEKVFDVNVHGTFNVLESAARNKIKKVVFTSSESTLGFAFMNNRMVPEYIPIDEHHPLRPQDAYGLSKVIGEQICRTYSAKYGIRTVCLREPWIWVPEPEQIKLYKKLVNEYGEWNKNLWTFVHVYDVAQAHRLAIEKDLETEHEVFFITAKENWTGKNSKDLLLKYYPETKRFAETFAGSSAIISSEKAHRMLLVRTRVLREGSAAIELGMNNSAIFILITVVSFSAQAQTDFQRVSPIFQDSNTAAIRFERNVNTYLWNANATYAYTDSGLYLKAVNAFTSSFISGQFRSFRDEQNFSLSAIQKTDSPFSIAVEAQSFVLSDNQTLGNSNAGIHSGALGVQFRPAMNVTVTPLLGMRYDKQQHEQDEGINYRFHAIVDSIEFSGYRTEFSGHINQSDLGKRQFKNDTAKLHIATEFSPGSIDSVQVRWLLNRSDFYVPTDSNVIRTFGVRSNIRSRNEQLWGVQNLLSYDIGSGFGTRFIVNVESRTITNAFRYKDLSVLLAIPYNTSVRELRIEGGVNVDFRTNSTLATIGFQLSERDEKHLLEKIDGVENAFQENRARQESRLDNTAFKNTISANIFTVVSPDDDLSFLSSLSVLRYDTPDTNNTDDRDELLINLSLRETHRFSSVLTAAITTEATLAHLVYISRNKSASNNWNRIFRLYPELSYRPAENFRMFNSFEVLANYTVFDFESLIPTVKSYSYRQVAFLDTTSYDMTKRVGIDLFLNVRVFERGELRWKEFSERPLQRVEEVTFSPQIRYSFKEQWYFAIGFRSFAQKRFKYVNTLRQFENTFLSAGPTSNIMIRLSSRSLIEVRGWKEFQRQSRGKVQEFSNMTMNVRYYF